MYKPQLLDRLDIMEDVYGHGQVLSLWVLSYSINSVQKPVDLPLART